MDAPFYFLLLTEAAERQRFIDNYKRASGNELPAHYVRKAWVVQFYVGLQPVAGFILNIAERTSLRCLTYLDRSVRQQMLENEGILACDLLEITANYMLPGLSRRQKRIFYKVMLTLAYRYAKQLGKKYLCAGSVVRKLQIQQMRLLSRIIYHGPVRSSSQTRIKKRTALLKIYVVEVGKVPLHASLLMINQYVIQVVKNSATQWIRRLKNRLSFPPDANRGTILDS
jgi:hypothetical protein